jgi:hypothetical protein
VSVVDDLLSVDHTIQKTRSSWDTSETGTVSLAIPRESVMRRCTIPKQTLRGIDRHTILWMKRVETNGLIMGWIAWPPHPDPKSPQWQPLKSKENLKPIRSSYVTNPWQSTHRMVSAATHGNVTVWEVAHSRQTMRPREGMKEREREIRSFDLILFFILF